MLEQWAVKILRPVCADTTDAGITIAFHHWADSSIDVCVLRGWLRRRHGCVWATPSGRRVLEEHEAALKSRRAAKRAAVPAAIDPK